MFSIFARSLTMNLDFKLKGIMKMKDTEDVADEVVLEEDQIVCALTKKIKPANEKELTLQSMIMMLDKEYNFDLKDMARDFPFSCFPHVFIFKKIHIDNQYIMNNFSQKWVSHAKKGLNLQYVCTQKA